MLPLTRSLALATLAASLALTAFTGCEATPTKEEMRPNVSDIVVGDRGMQSKDLVEMTDKLAPDILKIPEIAGNPNKISVVMTGITNKLESEPGRNLDIYVARMRAKLNKYARGSVMFVEKRNTTEGLQATEGAGTPSDIMEEGSRYGTTPPPTRYVPSYALKGEFYDKMERKTNYYLCTFQLTNIKTGEIVWEGSYEVRTLNY